MLYNLINQTKILFCRMDPARMETDEEQPLRRDQGRSKEAVREDQVSGASSSDPMGGDVGMESMQEPPVPFTAPEGSGPFQTQSQMPDFSNWVDMISQAVMSLASGPSSQTGNVDYSWMD